MFGVIFWDSVVASGQSVHNCLRENLRKFCLASINGLGDMIRKVVSGGSGSPIPCEIGLKPT